jgi:Domain of unknown function (DUF4270)
MKNTWIALFGLAVCLTIAASCNKTSLVGAELFENDKLNLQFTDTLTINALTDAPAPVMMYFKNATPIDNLPIGNMPDAYFGKLESTIYANFGTRNYALPDFLGTSVEVIDSVRLILPYSAIGTYGDTTAVQKLTVYQLQNELKGDTLYSDQSFGVMPTPLGSLSFAPTPSTVVPRYISALPGATKNDTIYNIPHIRIALDTSLGRKILQLDSMTYKDTTGFGFHSWLKGLAIKAETPANCIFQLNMGATPATAPTGQTNTIAGIYVYYRVSKTDTLRKVYTFQTTGQPRFANYKNDYKNGKIKDFVGTPAKADTLIFLQSLGGSVARFEFPNLKNLGTVAINKAELEFTIADYTDTKTHPPLEQLVLLYGNAKIANGNLGYLSSVLTLLQGNADPIPDATQSGYSLTAFATIPDFGGFPVTENGVQKYKMNVTQHLQRVLTGSTGTQLYLVPHFQYNKAGRVVLYGPKHPKYRAKLNLYYTKVDK